MRKALAVSGAIGLVFGPWFIGISVPLAALMVLYGFITYCGA
jgi:hypothetical protein